MKMAPMKKKAEKEGGRRKEMITVEVKNWTEFASNSKRLWRSHLRRRRRKRWRHPSLQMRLGTRQKQVLLDRCLVKVAQRKKESTDRSDSISDNDNRPTQ
jgi:hypothetical protein